MQTRSQGQENLVPINPEIGRRRRTRRRQQKMAEEQPKSLREYVMPDGSLGSSIIQLRFFSRYYK